MGTSKGYIAPTSPAWSTAKRAVSGFIRDKDGESCAKAVSRYSEASKELNTSNSTFQIAAGKVLGLSRSIARNGVGSALHDFGRDDLIGKDSEQILEEILDECTNYQRTREDALTAIAISESLKELGIKNLDELGNIDELTLLRQMVIEYINADFDFNFEEKIGKGRTVREKNALLDQIHKYVANTVYPELDEKFLYSLNIRKLGDQAIVKETVQKAYQVLEAFYGEQL